MGDCVDFKSVRCRRACWRTSYRCALAELRASAHAEPPLYAEDAPHAELFTGFDASDNATGGYVGAGYAFGKGLAAGAYARSAPSDAITTTPRFRFGACKYQPISMAKTATAPL